MEKQYVYIHPHHPHLLLCAEGLRLQLLILALGNPQELFKVSLRKKPSISVRSQPRKCPPKTQLSGCSQGACPGEGVEDPRPECPTLSPDPPPWEESSGN